MQIAVIGAGGFVGGWVAEQLHSDGVHQPIAYLRKWASSQRVARRAISVRMADSGMDFSGIGAVVNAAMPVSDEPAVVRDLYQRAKSAGVQRFIHMSSAAVYGSLDGHVDEQAEPVPDNPYARGKRDGELELLKLAAAGGPQVVILRPSIIYGPYSDGWTIRYAKRIIAGKWLELGHAGSGTSNLIHARDLVGAIVAAIESMHTEQSLVLNVNGPDAPTWNQYIRQFGDALDVEGRATPNGVKLMLSTWSAVGTRSLGRFAKKYAGGVISALTSSSVSAKSAVLGAKGVANLYPDPAEMALLRRKVTYDGGLAARKIGYTPKVLLQDGLQESVTWLRRHGLI